MKQAPAQVLVEVLQWCRRALGRQPALRCNILTGVSITCSFPPSLPMMLLVQQLP